MNYSEVYERYITREDASKPVTNTKNDQDIKRQQERCLLIPLDQHHLHSKIPKDQQAASIYMIMTNENGVEPDATANGPTVTSYVSCRRWRNHGIMERGR